MSNAVLSDEPLCGTNAADAMHPMLKFTLVLDQLKEEHEELRNRLKEFAAIEEIIRAGKANTDWYGTLHDLKARVESFLGLLDRHAGRAGEALFPTVTMYAEAGDPIMEIWDEDHRLAVQYMYGFLEELKKSVAPIYRPRAKRIISFLMDAHKLLQEHFKAEERYIYPVAEEIIADIDYLSC